MTIEESEQKDAQVWDTEREPKDRTKRKLMNGFHTVWDAKFEENGNNLKGRVALNKNVAFLKFVLTEVTLYIETSFRLLLGGCTRHEEPVGAVHLEVGQHPTGTTADCLPE